MLIPHGFVPGNVGLWMADVPLARRFPPVPGPSRGRAVAEPWHDGLSTVVDNAVSSGRRGLSSDVLRAALRRMERARMLAVGRRSRFDRASDDGVQSVRIVDGASDSRRTAWAVDGA